MPNVIIDGPILKDVDKKRTMVLAVTDAVEKAYGISREHIVVTIQEHSPENVGVGGVLITDQRKN
jgi:4-oxalocrotonate tautomerase family enzyme